MALKMLTLSTHDSRFGGHAVEDSRHIDPKLYDNRIVTLYSLYGDSRYAIYPSPIFKFLYVYIIRPLSNLIHCGHIRAGFKGNINGLCNVDYSIVSAQRILKKYGDVPDVILLRWVDGFVSSKTVRDLYRLTNARIVWVFTDEYCLGTGCHYPCECTGFMDNCNNCPAATNPKYISKAFAKRREYYKNIATVVVGPTSSCRKADISSLLSDAHKIIVKPHLSLCDYDRSESKERFGIDAGSFVIFIGASNIAEKRKGFSIFLEALAHINQQIRDRRIVLLIAGNVQKELFDSYSNIDVIISGFLSYDDLMKAYRASDIFVSSSIADSGPMMVNYSIECCTPVVSFDVGVAKDMVIPGKTGYIAKYKDSSDLAEGIMYFNNMSSLDLEEYRNNCRTLVIESENNTSWYKDLYEYLNFGSA